MGTWMADPDSEKESGEEELDLTSLGDRATIERALRKRIAVDVGLHYGGLDNATREFMDRLMDEAHEVATDYIEERIATYVWGLIEKEPEQDSHRVRKLKLAHQADGEELLQPDIDRD